MHSAIKSSSRLPSPTYVLMGTVWSESVVGRSTSFRNPPVFMKGSTQHNAEAAVLIGKKLIQRFTSSVPSGRRFMNGVSIEQCTGAYAEPCLLSEGLVPVEPYPGRCWDSGRCCCQAWVGHTSPYAWMFHEVLTASSVPRRVLQCVLSATFPWRLQ